MKISDSLAALIICLAFAFGAMITISITDITNRHQKPDTLLQKAIQYVNAYDYQLDISTIPDSIMVMDGRRYVGTIPMWDNSPLDSLLKADNE